MQRTNSALECAIVDTVHALMSSEATIQKNMDLFNLVKDRAELLGLSVDQTMLNQLAPRVIIAMQRSSADGPRPDSRSFLDWQIRIHHAQLLAAKKSPHANETAAQDAMSLQRIRSASQPISAPHAPAQQQQHQGVHGGRQPGAFVPQQQQQRAHTSSGLLLQSQIPHEQGPSRIQSPWEEHLRQAVGAPPLAQPLLQQPFGQFLPGSLGHQNARQWQQGQESLHPAINKSLLPQLQISRHQPQSQQVQSLPPTPETARLSMPSALQTAGHVPTTPTVPGAASSVSESSTSVNSQIRMTSSAEKQGKGRALQQVQKECTRQDNVTLSALLPHGYRSYPRCLPHFLNRFATMCEQQSAQSTTRQYVLSTDVGTKESLMLNNALDIKKVCIMQARKLGGSLKGLLHATDWIDRDATAHHKALGHLARLVGECAGVIHSVRKAKDVLAEKVQMLEATVAEQGEALQALSATLQQTRELVETAQRQPQESSNPTCSSTAQNKQNDDISAKADLTAAAGSRATEQRLSAIESQLAMLLTGREERKQVCNIESIERPAQQSCAVQCQTEIESQSTELSTTTMSDHQPNQTSSSSHQPHTSATEVQDGTETESALVKETISPTDKPQTATSDAHTMADSTHVKGGCTEGRAVSPSTAVAKDHTISSIATSTEDRPTSPSSARIAKYSVSPSCAMQLSTTASSSRRESFASAEQREASQAVEPFALNNNKLESQVNPDVITPEAQGPVGELRKSDSTPAAIAQEDSRQSASPSHQDWRTPSSESPEMEASHDSRCKDTPPVVSAELSSKQRTSEVDELMNTDDDDDNEQPQYKPKRFLVEEDLPSTRKTKVNLGETEKGGLLDLFLGGGSQGDAIVIEDDDEHDRNDTPKNRKRKNHDPSPTPIQSDHRANAIGLDESRKKRTKSKSKNSIFKKMRLARLDGVDADDDEDLLM